MVAPIVVFLIGIIGAALSRILADEFKAWTPWLTARFIRRAVAKLPERQRERYEEEWQGHVNEVPGEIGKLATAFDLLSVARTIATEEFEDEASDRTPPDATDASLATEASTQPISEWKVKALKKQADLLKRQREADVCPGEPVPLFSESLLLIFRESAELKFEAI